MRVTALAVVVAILAVSQVFASTHALRLTDGRVIRGELVRATRDTLWFQVQGESAPMSFGVADVVSILFSMPGGDQASERRDPVTVPGGARIRVALSAPIATARSGVGDTFFATLVDDLTDGERVVVPAGKRVKGRVRKVVKPRRKGDRVALELILASVPVEGKSMLVVTDHFGVQSDGKGNMNTTGPGGIEGVTLLQMMDGWNITIPGGTVLVFHLVQPLTIR